MFENASEGVTSAPGTDDRRPSATAWALASCRSVWGSRNAGIVPLVVATSLSMPSGPVNADGGGAASGTSDSV